MKRADTQTPLFPSFMRIEETKSGVQKLTFKEEPGSVAAGKIMGCSSDTAKRMAQAGIIFARRKSHALKSPWMFCSDCCVSWHEWNQPCAAHRSAESRAVSRDPVLTG